MRVDKREIAVTDGLAAAWGTWRVVIARTVEIKRLVSGIRCEVRKNEMERITAGGVEGDK